MAKIVHEPTDGGQPSTYYECECGELSITKRCEFCGCTKTKKCTSRPVTGTGPA